MTTTSEQARLRLVQVIERVLNSEKAAPPSVLSPELTQAIADELEAIRMDEREQCALRVEASLRAKRAMNSKFAVIHAAADAAYREAANACRAGWTQSGDLEFGSRPPPSSSSSESSPGLTRSRPEPTRLPGPGKEIV